MAERITKTSLLCALSLVAFTIENLFPPFFVPGARLGVGNVFVVLCLIYIGYIDATLLIAAKSILAAIFAGNFFAVAYSFTAGIVSLSLTYILLRYAENKVSLIAVGSLAATVNNLVQLSVFALVTKSVGVFTYAPYLSIAGVLAGAFTGIICLLITKNDFKFLVLKTDRLNDKKVE